MPLFKSQFLDADHKILIDEVDVTTTYIGDLAVEYTNGSPSFDKVWDNRTSYPYS